MTYINKFKHFKDAEKAVSMLRSLHLEGVVIDKIFFSKNVSGQSPGLCVSVTSDLQRSVAAEKFYSELQSANLDIGNYRYTVNLFINGTYFNDFESVIGCLPYRNYINTFRGFEMFELKMKKALAVDDTFLFNNTEHTPTLVMDGIFVVKADFDHHRYTREAVLSQFYEYIDWLHLNIGLYRENVVLYLGDNDNQELGCFINYAMKQISKRLKMNQSYATLLRLKNVILHLARKNNVKCPKDFATMASFYSPNKSVAKNSTSREFNVDFEDDDVDYDDIFEELDDPNIHKFDLFKQPIQVRSNTQVRSTAVTNTHRQQAPVQSNNAHIKKVSSSSSRQERKPAKKSSRQERKPAVKSSRKETKPVVKSNRKETKPVVKSSKKTKRASFCKLNAKSGRCSRAHGLQGHQDGCILSEKTNYCKKTRA